MLGEIEQDERDDDRQPDGDAEAEEAFLPDIGDDRRHAGEDHLAAAQGEGEAAEQDAGAERGDEGTDLELHRQQAVDHARHDAGKNHRRNDDGGTVAGLAEHRPEHGKEADHIAEREVELAGDERNDGGKGDAGNDRLDDEEVGEVLRGEEAVGGEVETDRQEHQEEQRRVFLENDADEGAARRGRAGRAEDGVVGIAHA